MNSKFRLRDREVAIGRRYRLECDAVGVANRGDGAVMDRDIARWRGAVHIAHAVLMVGVGTGVAAIMHPAIRKCQIADVEHLTKTIAKAPTVAMVPCDIAASRYAAADLHTLGAVDAVSAGNLSRGIQPSPSRGPCGARR